MRYRINLAVGGLAIFCGLFTHVASVHAHRVPHHAPEPTQQAQPASAATTPAAPGISGQGKLRFKVLVTSDLLPEEAKKVLVSAHGGFAVDHRNGKEETYFSLPGAGILRISADMKKIQLVETS